MASSNETTTKILVAIGQLQTNLERLREDFTEERKSSSESWSAVHRRLDDQTRDIASMTTAFALMKVSSEQIQTKHSEEVEPAIEEWKKMKTLGLGIVGLIAIGGLSLGAVLTWASEAAASYVRSWLHIS